jgi:hypothetical protein
MSLPLLATTKERITAPVSFPAKAENWIVYQKALVKTN